MQLRVTSKTSPPNWYQIWEAADTHPFIQEAVIKYEEFC